MVYYYNFDNFYFLILKVLTIIVIMAFVNINIITFVELAIYIIIQKFLIDITIKAFVVFIGNTFIASLNIDHKVDFEI